MWTWLGWAAAGGAVAALSGCIVATAWTLTADWIKGRHGPEA